jgi:hypothetical protein
MQVAMNLPDNPSGWKIRGKSVLHLNFWQFIPSFFDAGNGLFHDFTSAVG